MKTAIEWLEEQMETWGHFPRWMRDDIVKKAKEMEKEQIIHTYDEGVLKGQLFIEPINGEQYYNTKFKSE
jgi:hypothetical protein